MTVAGNGKDCCYKDHAKANEVSLDSVLSLAVNSLGDIFISEGQRVRKVDAQTGLISTVAGDGKTGNTTDELPAVSTSFRLIWGLAVAANDDLFIADRGRGEIVKLDATGRVFRVAGDGKDGFGGDGGPALDASFRSVGSIAFDKSGNLIIADEGNCRLRRVDHNTGIIQTVVVTEPMQACSEEYKNNWLLPSPSDLAIDPKGSYRVPGNRHKCR